MIGPLSFRFITRGRTPRAAGESPWGSSKSPVYLCGCRLFRKWQPLAVLYHYWVVSFASLSVMVSGCIDIDGIEPFELDFLECIPEGGPIAAAGYVEGLDDNVHRVVPVCTEGCHFGIRKFLLQELPERVVKGLTIRIIGGNAWCEDGTGRKGFYDKDHWGKCLVRRWFLVRGIPSVRLIHRVSFRR